MYRFATSVLKSVLISACMTFALHGQVATATWTGGAGTSNWTDGNNWSWQGDNGQCQGFAPNLGLAICSNPNVVIPGGFSVNAALGGVNNLASVNNFSIAGGSSLQGMVGAVGTTVMVAQGAALRRPLPRRQC